MTIGERMKYTGSFAAGHFPDICKKAAIAFTKTVIATSATTYIVGFLIAGLVEKNDDRTTTKTEED